jgi:hypothetical protein
MKTRMRKQLTWRQELRNGGFMVFVQFVATCAVAIESFHLPKVWFVWVMLFAAFVGMPAFMILTEDKPGAPAAPNGFYYGTLAVWLLWAPALLAMGWLGR